jgi:mRNA-degrading endonuclease RelE of RelBE toxin-antitoxin system
MAYAVYTTESFDEEVEKLADSDRAIIRKIFTQLKENPYVGDAIRFRFFREKRIREKRIYFLVYEELSAVLVVAFGGKKIQQRTIDEIIKMLPEFKKYIEELIKD